MPARAGSTIKRTSVSTPSLPTYKDLLDQALKSQFTEGPLLKYIEARRLYEAKVDQVIKEKRPKHPGLANHEILNRYAPSLSKPFTIKRWMETQ